MSSVNTHRKYIKFVDMFVNDTKSKGIEKSRLKKFREHMFDRGKMEGDITVSGFDLSLLRDELSILPRYRSWGCRIYFTRDLIKGGLLAFCDDDFQTGVRKYSLMNSFLYTQLSYFICSKIFSVKRKKLQREFDSIDSISIF